MVLKLYAEELRPLTPVEEAVIIANITNNPNLPTPVRQKHILLLKDPLKEVPEGFRAVLVFQKDCSKIPEIPADARNVISIPDDQEYLMPGDVVRLNLFDLSLRSIYRINSKHNSLLLTERCNHFCLMCSQPPKKEDDSYIANELLQAIPLMSRSTREIGITGGEPTLLGSRFIDILRTIKNFLPETSVHVLSNGRSFINERFVKQIAELRIRDLMFGIPIYSDVSHIHDYVVQADGAFDQTIRGILNMKTHGQKIEIRVVIHKQTYERLPQLAEFIARNLLFVDHVALMGLEMMGFTPINLEDLWIDPIQYQPQLLEAVSTLSRYRMRVSIYNHQLCLLDRRLWEFSVKSISDWKNEYMPECEPCTRKSECGGFFASARLRYSDSITPFS
ncbi:MAG: His-Xaa-Ser system radical SAM maturase HxsC [Cyanobacteria bacterium HKST-UBA02]|nr:His-Xaa-Ser system radical SAM maturase HxsC [Cyanobacteria bacterium HKST-UBA02]